MDANRKEQVGLTSCEMSSYMTDVSVQYQQISVLVTISH